MNLISYTAWTNLAHLRNDFCPVQIGWTSEQLAHVLNLVNQLKENSQKCDDDMDRWVQFCSRIDEVINQYQLLYNQTEMQRRQLPITLFFYPLKNVEQNEMEGTASCKRKWCSRKYKIASSASNRISP